jgi:hypothetical protein
MNMAEGSIEEYRYYLILAKDLNYGDTSRWSEFWLLTPYFHMPQRYQGR